MLLYAGRAYCRAEIFSIHLWQAASYQALVLLKLANCCFFFL
ncbi:hypothetical protein D920_00935 [Enterococcus faecalis 13-SD-W-01]|nr:hypothetical protein D920_00935 [Enterococcus faecalis 13-SD-W-01]